jgi:hypothetical protein
MSIFQETADNKKGIPMNFHNTPIEKLKTKPRYTVIEAKLARLPEKKKVTAPDPTTYKQMEAFKKAVVPNSEKGYPAWSGPSNYKEGFKPKVSIFVENVHKFKRHMPPAISPKRNYADYKMLSKSPSLAKCRH